MSRKYFLPAHILKNNHMGVAWRWISGRWCGPRVINIGFKNKTILAIASNGTISPAEAKTNSKREHPVSCWQETKWTKTTCALLVSDFWSDQINNQVKALNTKPGPKTIHPCFPPPDGDDKTNHTQAHPCFLPLALLGLAYETLKNNLKERKVPNSKRMKP